ncbi:hypothetical protein [Paraburkholderia sp. BCC1876]|uniref:hypothetical protein n=1 Tax=Paraburkholderia sp. BCC1876 TaxID=2676303 RepID=UPI0015926C8B|nr:hypothetical protein [Paraburkholderia sp. BCC1876]
MTNVQVEIALALSFVFGMIAAVDIINYRYPMTKREGFIAAAIIVVAVCCPFAPFVF